MRQMVLALSNLPERSAGLLSARRILDRSSTSAATFAKKFSGSARASPQLNVNSALVVTPSRIIEVTTGGAMQVLPDAVFAAVRFVPGKKKRFGGGQESYL